ncbi:tail protein X [uncultured Pelagimonas sp.]|uniref:tail protein X n=1 Tax=uncultured Pelagimonas sp. TaxID=1618102 RepID=UPI00261FAB91|nr:tail protein X [uncultured Pelagimonas sp.]
MTQSQGYFEHHTIDGDRWDLLAYRYYGDAAKQSVLLDANRVLFLDPPVVPPLLLPAGLTLIVPVLDPEVVDEAGLPPWKRQEQSYD